MKQRLLNIWNQIPQPIQTKLLGGWAAFEGAAVGALGDGIYQLIVNGGFSRATLKETAMVALSAGIVALRNYFKQPPRQAWTDEQRNAAQSNNGGAK